MRVAPKIVLTDEAQTALTKLTRPGRTSVRLAQRARIVLLAAQGLENKAIANKAYSSRLARDLANLLDGEYYGKPGQGLAREFRTYGSDEDKRL